MPVGTAFIFAPAAELLVEIESRCAIARLHIGQPFRCNVKEGGIESNGSAYEGDDYPSLGGIVGFPESISPRNLAMVV